MSGDREKYHAIINPARDILGVLARRSIFAAERWVTGTKRREAARMAGVQAVIETIQAPYPQQTGVMNSEARKRLEAAGSGSDAVQEPDRRPGYRTAEYVAFLERGGTAPRREEVIHVDNRNFGSMGEEV